MSSTFGTESILILISALIFITSFLWKDFISDLQEDFFPKSHGYLGRFFYVLITTSILIIIIINLKDRLRAEFESQPKSKTKSNKSKSNKIIEFDDTPL